MKHTHTPGPWIVNPIQLNQIATADARFEIARASVCSNDHETIANARLIAAAPDHALILRAITTLGARWDAWNELRGEFCIGGFKYATGLDEFGCPIANGAIRAAIKKAMGEQA